MLHRSNTAHAMPKSSDARCIKVNMRDLKSKRPSVNTLVEMSLERNVSDSVVVICSIGFI